MTTQVNTKVRLVRCPKCRQVLAELPDVSLYKCGGCGTVLQAKNRRTDTDLSSQATDAAAKIQQNYVSEENESNLDLPSSCNGESSPGEDKIISRGDSSVELCVEDISVSDSLSTSPETNCHKSENSPLELEDRSEHERSENSLSQNSDGSFLNNRQGVKLESRDFSGEVVPDDTEHMEEDESGLNLYTSPSEDEGGNSRKMSQEALQQNDEKSENGSVNENGGKISVESSPANIASPENRKSTEPFVGVGEGKDGNSTFKRRSMTKSLNIGEGDSSSSSKVNFKARNEDNPNHFTRKMARNFGSATSVDTFGSSPLADPSSEPRIKLRDMTGSPTTRIYYAYDASESSYDGTDDQMLEQISQRNIEEADPTNTTERLVKDRRFRGNILTANDEPETNYFSPSSQFLGMKGRHENRDEFTEMNTNGNRMRLNKQQESPTSRLSRNLPSEQRSRSSSIPHHNLLPPRPGFHSSERPPYMGPDKMELLRTVCELKDQLDRIQFSSNVREKYSPPYFRDHLPLERGLYQDIRQNQAKGWAGNSNISRQAFSGEAAHYKNQINCSCLHCHPQDFRYSAQFPSQYKNVRCLGRNCQSRCNISSSSSPQRYTSSELSLHGQETNFEKHRDEEIKRSYLKEKYSAGKRHLRPVAGGAPVVICYHCSEILQLPADFLLFEKRYHRLRCSACMKILKFSLFEKRHIVPYDLLEADDFTRSTNERNPGQMSHSDSSKYVESVMYSDEYGRSFDRSCSTEGEGSVILRSVKRNSYDRKISSGSSYGKMEDKKMKSVLEEGMEKGKMENFESDGPSSSRVPKFKKGSSEIEEHNSPLHRLMGYSSPSQVLKQVI